jgi:hypothetical protein
LCRLQPTCSTRRLPNRRATRFRWMNWNDPGRP